MDPYIVSWWLYIAIELCVLLSTGQVEYLYLDDLTGEPTSGQLGHVCLLMLA